MLSNLTEIMCLIEETGDSTHVRTGRGSWGLPHPKFWATQIFWAVREILAKPFLQKFPCFASSFFYFKLK